MITGNLIHMMLGSAETYFVAAPYNCHLSDVLAVSEDTGMADETVTVTDGIGGTDIGAAVFATDVAGELATYTPTAGNREMDEDDIIQIVTSTFDAGTDKVHVTLVLDPYRITPAT